MRIVHALTEALAAKDAATYSHSQRTAFYATLLAEELGMEERALDDVEVAGLLHDIGKIGIPDAILRKPEPLTLDEWTIVHRHSALGANILAGAGMADIAAWVHHLHERFDGCGYPDGLAGEEIPIESRVLHAADVLDAMTANRVYSPAADSEEATAALEEAAGSQLDPEVALALAELVRDVGPDLMSAAKLQSSSGSRFRRAPRVALAYY